jgi:hypothetical protein
VAVRALWARYWWAVLLALLAVMLVASAAFAQHTAYLPCLLNIPPLTPIITPTPTITPTPAPKLQDGEYKADQLEYGYSGYIQFAVINGSTQVTNARFLGNCTDTSDGGADYDFGTRIVDINDGFFSITIYDQVRLGIMTCQARSSTSASCYATNDSWCILSGIATWRR